MVLSNFFLKLWFCPGINRNFPLSADFWWKVHFFANPLTLYYYVIFFQARIVIFGTEVPITKGYPIILHYGCVSEQATISKLVSTLNKSTGEVLKNKPRFLTGNSSAMVNITVSKSIPVETYKECVIFNRPKSLCCPIYIFYF